MAACQSAKMTILWKKIAHAVGVEQKSPRWGNTSLAKLFYVLSFLLSLTLLIFQGTHEKHEKHDMSSPFPKVSPYLLYFRKEYQYGKIRKPPFSYFVKLTILANKIYLLPIRTLLFDSYNLNQER